MIYRDRALERALRRNRCNLWMTGGSSFTKRGGGSSGTANQDFNPEDVGLAFSNGWTALRQDQFPSLLDFPEFGVQNPVGAMNAYKIFQTGIPFIMASTGSFANNGALTGMTAGPAGFWNGPAYLNFPAGAIVAAGAAGWYYTVLSSTTAGTVYNNTYTSGQPFIPGSAVLSSFVTTGPGAYTGVTTAQTALSFTIPANSMGANGQLWFSFLLGFNGSTNNKTVTIKIGSTVIFSLVEATAATIAYQGDVYFQNQGATNANATQKGGATGASTVAQTFSTIDTTVNQTCTVNITDATATDWTSIDSFSCVAVPG